MTIKELFDQGWYFAAAVIIGYGAIILMFGCLAYQLFRDNKKGTETFLTRLLDKGTVWLAGFMEKHFTWLNDEEPTCPEWADEKLWKESLKR